MTKQVVEIKNISKSNQEKIYNKLLNGDLKIKTMVHTEFNGPHWADIDTFKNDFCLSSWTFNYYVRPPKAVRYERYKSLGKAWQALNKTVKAKTCLSIDKDLMIYDCKSNFLFILRMN